MKQLCKRICLLHLCESFEKTRNVQANRQPSIALVLDHFRLQKDRAVRSTGSRRALFSRPECTFPTLAHRNVKQVLFARSKDTEREADPHSDIRNKGISNGFFRMGNKTASGPDHCFFRFADSGEFRSLQGTEESEGCVPEREPVSGIYSLLGPRRPTRCHKPVCRFPDCK